MHTALELLADDQVDLELALLRGRAVAVHCDQVQVDREVLAGQELRAELDRVQVAAPCSAVLVQQTGTVEVGRVDVHRAFAVRVAQRDLADRRVLERAAEPDAERLDVGGAVDLPLRPFAVPGQLRGQLALGFDAVPRVVAVGSRGVVAVAGAGHVVAAHRTHRAVFLHVPARGGAPETRRRTRRLQGAVVVEHEGLDVDRPELARHPGPGERVRILQVVARAEDQPVAEDVGAAADPPGVADAEHVLGLDPGLADAVEVDAVGVGVRGAALGERVGVRLAAVPGLGVGELDERLGVFGRLPGELDARARRHLVAVDVRVAGLAVVAAVAEAHVAGHREGLRAQADAGLDARRFATFGREAVALGIVVVAVLGRGAVRQGQGGSGERCAGEDRMHRFPEGTWIGGGWSVTPSRARLSGSCSARSPKCLVALGGADRLPGTTRLDAARWPGQHSSVRLAAVGERSHDHARSVPQRDGQRK